MNKEELLELLRENLTISITTDYQSGYYNENYHKIKVEIKFDDEVISSSEDTIRA